MTAAWLAIALAAAWVAFAYAGYPLALWLLGRVSPRPVQRAAHAPSLSVIVAVHDGAARLACKLEETCALAYPGAKEILVASDASADATDAIARSFAARGVRLVRLARRGGKEAAQAAAIAAARGEILVFTDVGAEIEPGALAGLVAPFADPRVGCVSSEDLVDRDEGEGAYAAYEMAIRRLESRAGSLVGCSGSLFAARRSLCDPWPAHLASDFRIALEAARRGLRAVSEPAARARIAPVRDPRREWARKVRTVRRGVAVLCAYPDLLAPRRGRVAFALWGHKVARFTAPAALAVLLAASAVAATESAAARALLAGQLAFYALGAASLASRSLRRATLPRLAGFFLLVNASILVAWGHHLAGRRAVAWTPTAR
ncbi:MAG: glycosyltransferase family 2 protein [Proteobacteria bacterium]|nr:MAG: glycosyltransferase family 2 protein [Pseudomonadota bacterium]